MKARSNGPASSGVPAAKASSAGALTTSIRSSGTPARRQNSRARSVRSRSGSIVTIVPSVGQGEGHPQRRVADRRPDLDDPPAIAGEDREHPAASRGSGSGSAPAPRRPPSRAGPGGAARPVASIQSRSVASGIQVLSLFDMRQPPMGGVATQTRSPAPKYSPAARIVPAAIVPTLMYSRPVADSIDRDRAVWIAAQLTMSGKTRPTSRRSQTNSAHGPTSAAKAGDPCGPGAEPEPRHEQRELHGQREREPAREPHERRLGQPRRHEVPVAEDHRGPDAAEHRREGERARRAAGRSPRPPPPHDSAPATRASAAAASPAAATGAARRPRMSATP